MNMDSQEAQTIRDELAAASNAVRALMSERDAFRTELQTLQQRMTTQQAASTPVENPQAAKAAASLIDTRIIGKPETFAGEAAKFPDWAFVLKSYLGALDPRYPKMLEVAELSETPMLNASMEASESQLSCQLYYLLCMICKDKALDKVSNSGVGEGFEAWRSFTLEYQPKLASRWVGLLLNILSFRFTGELTTAVEAFEKQIRAFEQQSKQTVAEFIKLGISIMGMDDEATRDHLIKNAETLDTWEKVKVEIINIHRTKQFLANTPMPMNLGATPGGKGDGKKQEQRC